MLRNRQINADPRGRIARLRLPVAAGPLRRLAWAVEDRLIWGAGERLRGLVDVARWPFERLAWAIERRLVWPLRERTAGWSTPTRAAGAGALVAVATAAALVGVLWTPGGGGADKLASAPVAVATGPQTRPPIEQPPGPVLHGVPPSFGVGKGVGVGREDGGREGDSSAAAPVAPGGDAEASGNAEAGAQGEAAPATASSAKPVPAGPAAMKVARHFAKAFVFYEIGKRPAQSKAVFRETATPQLAGALAERPPRLPANAEVPKARVVNLVPGPRRGDAYTVSVSLLRLGLTSELRISLQHDKADGWRVAEVLG